MIPDIIKLISLILGISIAGERLITLIKSLFPGLAAAPATGAVQPADTPPEIARKIFLMILAFLCCWLTASFISGSYSQKPITIGSIGPIQIWLLGILASGGSAFWTNILGYVSALKDLNNQKAFKAQLHIQAKLAAKKNLETDPCGDRRKTDTTHNAIIMKTIRFTADFSGGAGTLKIQIKGYPDIDFAANGFKDIDLPAGNLNYTASGAASPGPGGGATLTITGDVITDSPQRYKAGPIVPNTHSMLIG